MTDIVERLRERAENGDGWTRPVAREAAAEIDRLRAEVHRLREVLEEIESPPIDVVCHGSWEAFEWAMERAADALKAPTP